VDPTRTSSLSAVLGTKLLGRVLLAELLGLAPEPIGFLLRGPDLTHGHERQRSDGEYGECDQGSTPFEQASRRRLANIRSRGPCGVNRVASYLTKADA
jgi:hypothetical protein